MGVFVRARHPCGRTLERVLGNGASLVKKRTSLIRKRNSPSHFFRTKGIDLLEGLEGGDS